MPFQFTLPSPGPLQWSSFFESSTHPGLLAEATSAHAHLRHALKSRSQGKTADPAVHLSRLLECIDRYVPLLLAIEAALNSYGVADSSIDIVLKQEVQCQWRTSIVVSKPPLTKSRRLEIKGIDSIICYVLLTKAEAHMLSAKQCISSLSGLSELGTEQGRLGTIQKAVQEVQQAASIFSHASTRSSQIPSHALSPDITTQSLDALQAMATAEFCLLMAFKDDHQLEAAIRERDQTNLDWMVAPTKIPKARSLLLSRLCCAAAEYLYDAIGGLGFLVTQDRVRLADGLLKYLTHLAQTARARACRFTAIHREGDGKTGEALAWLRAAEQELGFKNAIASEQSRGLSLSRMKASWQDSHQMKRHERRQETCKEDHEVAGRLEERIVVTVLYKQWTKQNDLSNTQRIPDHISLPNTLPSGRALAQVAPWQPPSLESGHLQRMTVSTEDMFGSMDLAADENDSSGEDDPIQLATSDALPGNSLGQTRTAYV